MKRVLAITALFALLISCNKEWTETKSKAEEFEELAIKDLIEKRDKFKWEAEAEVIKSSKEALEVYWASLREYKRRSWLNTGKEGGQKPFFYSWHAGDAWKAEKGVPKTWLQSIPDSLTCISLWGGFGKRPSEMTENQKKDLEIFHKKGSAVLLCWQTSAPGLGIPGSKDGEVNGWEHFRAKYPCDKGNDKWGEIYARELARYIIACGFDGYDVDWETCGDHGQVTDCGHRFMVSDREDFNAFVKEIAKYFGPVGEEFATKTQEERETNIKKLFEADTEGFNPNEKEFIDDFKPYLPADYMTKRYYLCADIPCGIPDLLRDHFKVYFDKHFMQDYRSVGVGGIHQLGGANYNSTSVSYEMGTEYNMITKARAVAAGEVWGIGAYHGEVGFGINSSNGRFQQYLKNNGITRKYNYYPWFREAMRIADPRPVYPAGNENIKIIITP